MNANDGNPTEDLPDVVVIGAGQWGFNHVLKLISMKRLLGVVDSSERALDVAKKKLADAKFSLDHISFCTRLEDLPLDRVKKAAVVIATPPTTHYEIAKDAISRFKGILIEKPMCTKYEEAQELIQIAQENNVVLMVGHLMRYSQPHQEFIRTAHENVISGDAQRVKMTRKKFGTIRTKENVLWSFAPHDISMLLAITGDTRPLSVRCVGQKVVSSEMEDFITLTVNFEGCLRAEVECSWLHPSKERKTIVYGKKGCMILDECVSDDDPGYANKVKSFSWSFDPNHGKQRLDGNIKDKTPPGTSAVTQDALVDELKHFLSCVSSGSSPLTDGKEGAQVLLLLQGAEDSLRKQGAEIQLQDIINASRKKMQTLATGANGNTAESVFVHPTAVIDDGASIGSGTKVWHFSHIMSGSRIGEKCNFGQNVYIGGRAKLGNNVKVQNNVSIYDGVEIEDDAFLGPSCVLTNVKTPRSFVNRKAEYIPTKIGRGATVGANATIVCGVNIGEYAFIGAGSVVTKDVRPYELVYGNPAAQHGWVSKDGVREH